MSAVVSMRYRGQNGQAVGASSIDSISVVEVEQRDRRARHLHRRRIVADVAARDRDAAAPDRMRSRLAIEDQELLERRRAQAVDQHRHAPARALRRGRRGCGRASPALRRPRSAAAASRCPARRGFPCRARSCRPGTSKPGAFAPGMRHGDNAMPIERVLIGGALRHLRDFRHPVALGGTRARDLEREDHPGDAAALLRARRPRRSPRRRRRSRSSSSVPESSTSSQASPKLMRSPP